MLERILLGDQGLRAGWALLLFLVILETLLALLGVNGLAFVLPASTTPSPIVVEQGWRRLALTESLSFGALALSSWLLSRLEQRPLRSYGIGLSTGTLSQLLKGLLAGAAILSALVCLLTGSHLLTFSGRLLSTAQTVQFAVIWFAVFFFVALFEEYLLRGFLQFTLARGIAGMLRVVTDTPRAEAIGFWTAAILLSFVFGLGHRNNPGESPIGLLSAALIGLVFCLSLWRTGSLWWAIGFHAAWDWTQSFVFGVADSGTMVRFHLLASRPTGRPLLSGGTTGPEGSLLILPVTCVIVAVILFTLPRTQTEPSALAAEPSR